MRYHLWIGAIAMAAQMIPISSAGAFEDPRNLDLKGRLAGSEAAIFPTSLYPAFHTPWKREQEAQIGPACYPTCMARCEQLKRQNLALQFCRQLCSDACSSRPYALQHNEFSSRFEASIDVKRQHPMSEPHETRNAE